MFRGLAVFVLSAIFLAGLSSPSHAQLRRDIGVVKGKVTLVNHQTNEVTVWDYDSGSEQSFSADQSTLGTLLRDQEVIVFFKKGTRIARNIKVVEKKGTAPVAKEATVPPQTVTTPAPSSPMGTKTTTTTTVPKTPVKERGY